MMKLSWFAIGIALSTGMATGCMVNGKPMFGGGKASSGSATSPGSAPAPKKGGDNAKRTRDLYQRFTYANVTAPDATTLFSQMGIAGNYNPAREMDNVDPTWIPGWDALSLTDEVQTAVLQAAINRSWQVHAHAEYKKYRASWAAIEQELRPQLAQAVALPEYHTRGAALAKLYTAVMERAQAAGLTSKRLRNVGFPSEIIRAMVELHRTAKTEFRLKAYFTPLSIAVDDVVKTARPFAEYAIERDLFTATMIEELPKLNEYGKAFAAVKWPVDADAMETARRKIVADATAELAGVRPIGHVPSIYDGIGVGGGGGKAEREPALRWFGPSTSEHKPIVVGKVTERGGASEVHLAGAIARSVPYGCKTTNQLSKIDPGKFALDCNFRTETTRYGFVVTFAALPDGIKLEPGDEVQFYGDIVRESRGRLKADFTVNARALSSIKRGGQVVATYW